MAAEYPDSVPTFQTNGTYLGSTPTHSTLHKKLNDEVEAIATTLGTNPEGSSDTVKERIAAIEGEVDTLQLAVETSFDDDDLSSGVLTVTHSGGLSAGYTAIVQVVNNSGAVVFPDSIENFTADSFDVDLTSYGTISGTWYCTYILKA